MFTEERREKILNIIEKNGRVITKDLAEKFGVSIDTIRRDLSELEEQQLLKRTHGGAIRIPKVRTMPKPPKERYGEGDYYQKAIAKAAVSYIKEGDTVFVGGAAIHYVMIQYLPTDISYTVITNSVEIALHIRNFNNITTYIIGGNVKNSGNITDALANEFVSKFYIDLSFATAGGLSERGLSTSSPEVALFHKTVYENSRKVIALIEHYKFGMDFFTVMFPLQGLSLVITDEETTEEQINIITAHGINVKIAES